MVVSHAGFVPYEAPRVAVAADGSLAAIQEASRITLLALPGGAAFAEIGIDPDALASDVAWVSAPARLLVLSRYEAYSTVHLLDPSGPRSIAEIRLEAPMRLVASVGSAGLVVGALGAAVLATSDVHLMPYQFPTRNVPVAAGAAATQFVVGLPGSIEEWDPQTRMPRRRLRLPRSSAITAVGGSDRLVWVTTQQEPQRIDVIPLVNRGQPKAHDLPEPIAKVASHPRSDLLACIGSETGRLYIIDLDGRNRMRVISPDGMDRVDSLGLLTGRTTGVLVAQAGRPVMFVPYVPGRDASDPALVVPRSDPALVVPRSDPALRVPAVDDEAPASEASASAVDEAEAGDAGEHDDDNLPRTHRSRYDDDDEREQLEAESSPSIALPISGSISGSVISGSVISAPLMSAGMPTAAAPHAHTPPVTPPSVTALFRRAQPPTQPPPLQAPSSRAPASPAKPTTSTSQRFSAWRDQVRQNKPRPEPIAAAPPAPSAGLPPARADVRQTWRDEVVAWSRAVVAGALEHNPPPAPPIDALIARFELAPHLQPALVLLYGAHLCGERGAAPVDVARVLDRRWDDALGRGELAQRSVVAYLGSRVLLSPILLRALDELPPTLGTLVGEPSIASLLGPCIVVAPAGEPLPAIAARCVSRVGSAVLAAHGEPDVTDLCFEARAYGAAPLVRPASPPSIAPIEPVILVLDDPALADQLELPRLA